MPPPVALLSEDSFQTTSLAIVVPASGKFGTAASQGKWAGCREVHMRHSVAHAVAGTIVSRRTADCHAERCSGLQGLVERRHRLFGPVAFRTTPADRDDRRLVGRVVDRQGDGI